MAKGIVLSDSHLFASRSDAFERFETVYPLLRESNLCVLNGDTFDFRWTILSSLEETVERAHLWLKELLAAYPEITFVFIAGNHDAHPLFMPKLDSLTSDFKNLRAIKYHLLLEDKLFLHGDTIHATDRTLPALDAYRQRFAYKDKQSPAFHLLFKTLIALRGPNVATALQNVDKNCEKISDYIDLHLKERTEQIKSVFYGHTHNPFQQHKCRGRLFTNTGSMIRNLDFLALPFEYESLEGAVFE